MVFSSSGEERRLVMSTKMGFWRWALASAAILIATGTAGARVIDPTGVTTMEPTAITLFPRLKVDLNTCTPTNAQLGPSFCSLTPEIRCNNDDDCNGCKPNGFCAIAPTVPCNADFQCPGAARDTVVQLTNTSEFLTKVLCFYTNTNSHCSNDPEQICTDENFRDVCPRGGLCVQGWVETDFHLTLTKRQPLSWSVNDGLSSLPLANRPGQGSPPQMNEGSIPPAPEVPFTGELFCVEVALDTELPSDRNDFKGEAKIVTTVAQNIDVNEHNAIGIKAIEGANNQDGTLNIGGPEAEYGVFNDTVDPPRFAGCPNVWTLNHFFDGANVVTHEQDVQGSVHSVLTIVPCERNYLFQTFNGPDITVQFLVFNEFEQRFSTSIKISCYEEIRLSDIGSILPGPQGDEFSIFNVGVQGTLTGLSRVRSVPGPNLDGYDGRGIALLLTENWGAGVCEGGPPMSGGAQTGRQSYPDVTLCATDEECVALEQGDTCRNPHVQTTSANVQFQGSRLQGDRVTIQFFPQ